MEFTFLMQLWLIFTVFLLNIFDIGFVFGKFFLYILKNTFPTFVLTFKEKGGLYHIIFLFLFFFSSLLMLVRLSGLIYVNPPVKPLFFNAFSYVIFALLNTFSLQEMSEIHLFIALGSFFKMLGG